MTTDLTGTIAMLKQKFDELKSGAADALSSLTKNSERKRSFSRFQNVFAVQCLAICKMTEILLDYFLPAADQSNPAHAMSRRSLADLESSNMMAMASSRVKRSEDGEAEPEPEGEPEPSDDYYCVKKSLGGNTLKSCLPKVILDKRPTHHLCCLFNILSTLALGLPQR